MNWSKANLAECSAAFDCEMERSRGPFRRVGKVYSSGWFVNEAIGWQPLLLFTGTHGTEAKLRAVRSLRKLRSSPVKGSKRRRVCPRIARVFIFFFRVSSFGRAAPDVTAYVSGETRMEIKRIRPGRDAKAGSATRFETLYPSVSILNASRPLVM